MKIKLLILSVLLSGCSNYVNMETFKASVKLCEYNGGIKYVTGKSFGKPPIVQCNNGAGFADPVRLIKMVNING